MGVRAYNKKSSENDLMRVNNKISEIEEFLVESSKDLKKLNNIDIFLQGNCLDYLAFKKKKELEKLAKLKKEYEQYHDIYLKKYGDEKRVDILIKTLNNTITREKIRSARLFLDEYVSCKICKGLGNSNE
ncbi:hypothetical protein [Borrelia anserina]|uniref:Flagellar protein n=1 Tax=Borrelia anserina BA2 TaxID=1313293 RepID=W5SMU3_BORAN|nr:hypothetical protein [Borrelia anserina]AHH08252.1 Flagellar protein [Borrelia anserina BA2]